MQFSRKIALFLVQGRVVCVILSCCGLQNHRNRSSQNWYEQKKGAVSIRHFILVKCVSSLHPRNYALTHKKYGHACGVPVYAQNYYSFLFYLFHNAYRRTVAAAVVAACINIATEEVKLVCADAIEGRGRMVEAAVTDIIEQNRSSA